MTSAAVDMSLDELEALFEMPAHDKGWSIIVLDDEVNSMDYVVVVFMKHFKLDENTATRKMAEVHYEGRSVLDTGDKEKMDAHKDAMTAYGLRAIVEQND